MISSPEVNDFLVLVCSTKHAFAEKKSVKVEELQYESFAKREQGSGTRELFERYMSEKGIPIRIVFEANSSDTIKKAVIDNQCLAVISIRLVEEEMKSGKIHVIQNTDCDWDRYFSVAYHKNKAITDEMNCIVTMIVQTEKLYIENGNIFIQVNEESSNLYKKYLEEKFETKK